MQKNSLSQQEINEKIHNLRLKLNETYEKQGHTDEVIKISQALDMYIALVQKQLIENKNLVFEGEMIFRLTDKELRL